AAHVLAAALGVVPAEARLCAVRWVAGRDVYPAHRAHALVLRFAETLKVDGAREAESDHRVRAPACLFLHFVHVDLHRIDGQQADAGSGEAAEIGLTRLQPHVVGERQAEEVLLKTSWTRPRHLEVRAYA